MSQKARTAVPIILEEARTRLLAMIADRPKLDALFELTPPHDEGDVAGVSVEKEGAAHRITLGDLKRRRAEIALQQIEDGTYGTCLACGDAIKKKRLEAVPEALFCGNCQEKLEQNNLPDFQHFAEPKSAL